MLIHGGTDPDEGSGVLQPDDSLDRPDGVTDVLDTGWSPAEHPWVVDGWGTTAHEALLGESLGARLAREIAEPEDPAGDGLGDASDTDGELIDDEVGNRRAGRLVDTSALWSDGRSELYFAVDVGVDGGAASAEEAAVHIVGEGDEDVLGRRY